LNIQVQKAATEFYPDMETTFPTFTTESLNELIAPGRSSGLLILLRPSRPPYRNRTVARWGKRNIELTATGIAPDFNRIPFSFSRALAAFLKPNASQR